MQRQADQFRQNMVWMNRYAAKVEAKAQRKARLRRLVYSVWAPAASAVEAPRPKRRRSRHVLPVAVGLGLGLGCVFVPWYMFVDSGKFDLTSETAQVSARIVTNQPAVVAPARTSHLTTAAAPVEQAAFVAAAPVAPAPVAAAPAVPAIAAVAESVAPIKVSIAAPLRTADAGLDIKATVEQTLAPKPALYKLVHIANGRAMIEDEHGLVIVKQGSRLPDNNQVQAIEQREGQWVMVTSADQILAATE